MLWAWERPERLSFIDPEKTGVAYLAETIYLTGDSVLERPRMQPLEIPHGTAVIAVVRIESSALHVTQFSTAQRQEVVRTITRLTEDKQLKAIQIDYDARLSERVFYRALIVELRKSLPASLKLSITALASWCLDDNWIGDLPIDDAVPMLFQMGPDSQYVKQHLRSGGEFIAGVCSNSLGLSMDEPVQVQTAGKRIYVFNRAAWDRSSFTKAMQKY